VVWKFSVVHQKAALNQRISDDRNASGDRASAALHFDV
jgi:hypothetical protein